MLPYNNTSIPHKDHTHFYPLLNKPINSYLTDAKELSLEILDSSNKIIGKANMPLKGLLSSDAIEEKITVYAYDAQKKGTKKEKLGELLLFAESVYANNANNNTNNNTNNIEEGYSGGNGNGNDSNILKSAQIDISPPRIQMRGAPPKVVPAIGIGTSSFQMNEARVFTDNSDRYAEWPANSDPSAMNIMNIIQSHTPAPEAKSVNTSPSQGNDKVNVNDANMSSASAEDKLTLKLNLKEKLKEKEKEKEKGETDKDEKGGKGKDKDNEDNKDNKKVSKYASPKEKKRALERLKEEQIQDKLRLEEEALRLEAEAYALKNSSGQLSVN